MLWGVGYGLEGGVGRALFVNTESGEIQWRFQGQAVSGMDISSNDRLIVTAHGGLYNRMEVNVWDRASGSLLENVRPGLRTGRLAVSYFVRNNSTIFSANSGMIKLIDRSNQEIVDVGV